MIPRWELGSENPPSAPTDPLLATVLLHEVSGILYVGLAGSGSR